MKKVNSYNIKYGSLWPEGHFGRKIAWEFAESMAGATDGRIRIEVTPPSPDEELTRQVLSGELAMTSGHAIQDYVPELGLGYLPYLYKSYDQFRSIWKEGTPIANDMLHYFEKRQVAAVPIGYSVIGFRDMILRDHKIEKPDDFKGLKVRNDGSTTTHNVFEAFGADPQVIEYHKVKQALADGEVDAAANTTFNLIYMQWYKVTSNVSLTSHQILTNLEIVNLDFWNGLTQSDQELFREHMHIACDSFAETAKRERHSAIEKLSGYLAVNTVPTETLHQLEAEVEPLKKTFVKRYELEREYRAILDHTV